MNVLADKWNNFTNTVPIKHKRKLAFLRIGVAKVLCHFSPHIRPIPSEIENVVKIGVDRGRKLSAGWLSLHLRPISRPLNVLAALDWSVMNHLSAVGMSRK